MEFFIEKNRYFDRVEVYASTKIGGERYVYLHKDGQLVEQKLQEGAVRDGSLALFYIPLHEWKNFVNTIANDTKPELGKFVDGELIATKRHLEDMQKIVTKTLNL